MISLGRFIDARFTGHGSSRIVVFEGDRGRRNLRGYLVRSEAEEQKIRAFLKMFYAAYFAVIFLGTLLWVQLFVRAYNASRDSYAHLARAVGVSVAIWTVLVLLPVVLLWKSYKREFLNFFTAQDEVALPNEYRAEVRKRKQIVLFAAILGLLLMAAGAALLRAR